MVGHSTGQVLAIAAGLCAASASVFAKLAVTSDVVLNICQDTFRLVAANRQSTDESTSLSPVQQDDWSDFCALVKYVPHVDC